MKLAAGLQKIVLVNELNAEENHRRANARGTIFKPVFAVWVIGEDGKATKHEMYSFKPVKLIPRTTTGPFPFTWAPTPMKSIRAWFETEAEMDVTTTQPVEDK